MSPQNKTAQALQFHRIQKVFSVNKTLDGWGIESCNRNEVFAYLVEPRLYQSLFANSTAAIVVSSWVKDDLKPTQETVILHLDFPKK